VNERDVNHKAAQYEEDHIEVLNLRVINDGSQHQEHCGQQHQDWNNYGDLGRVYRKTFVEC